jgi:voltage-gated potassium channel
LTTVGYGDVAPITALGKTLAAAVSLLGIALVAVPTGILAASFSEVIQRRGKSSREPEEPAD